MLPEKMQKSSEQSLMAVPHVIHINIYPKFQWKSATGQGLSFRYPIKFIRDIDNCFFYQNDSVAISLEE